MRYALTPRSSGESNDHRERMEGPVRDPGFSFWPVVCKHDGAFPRICGPRPLTADGSPLQRHVVHVKSR